MRSFANLINLPPLERFKEILQSLSVRYRNGSEIMVHSLSCKQWYVLCCGEIESNARGMHAEVH